MSTVPYIFAGNTGNIPLSQLDADFANVKLSVDYVIQNTQANITSVGTLTSLSLIGVEGTFVNTQNIRREGNNGSIENLSVIPSSVTTIYTNKPHWTSTLDGGTF